MSRGWDKSEKVFSLDREERKRTRRQDEQKRMRKAGRGSQRSKGQYIRERDLTDRLEYVRTIRATAEAPVPLSLQRCCTDHIAWPRTYIHARLKPSRAGRPTPFFHLAIRKKSAEERSARLKPGAHVSPFLQSARSSRVLREERRVRMLKLPFTVKEDPNEIANFIR